MSSQLLVVPGQADVKCHGKLIHLFYNFFYFQFKWLLTANASLVEEV